MPSYIFIELDKKEKQGLITGGTKKIDAESDEELYCSYVGSS
jgi:hypothetical protein